jgi:hypothetical protein
MLPSAITKKMLLGWGGDAVYAQAEGMVRKGLVLKADVKGDRISGVIARESASEIYTKLRLRSNGTIESLCPCSTNRNLGLVCPHVVALGITLMLRHSDPLREQKYNEEQRRARRLAEVDAMSYIQRSARGVPARVLLSLPQTWTADFWQGHVTLTLQFVAEGRRLSRGTVQTVLPRVSPDRTPSSRS